MSALLHSATVGVFAQLADPMQFPSVCVEHCAVIRPREITLAQDAMPAAIKQLWM
jgi:hypothetical protein